jgi:multicomponent Na+:H+ antiporter subunit D
MTALVPGPVVIPLAGGCLALLLGRAGARTTSVLAGGATLLASALVTGQVWRHGPLRHPVGGWAAPLGIELRADGLAVFMLLVTAAAGVAIVAYALGYFPRAPVPAGEGWEAGESFWPLLLFLWTALNGLFLSADVFNFYVTLELMTLCAVALAVLGGENAALRAGMRYLLAAVLGSLAYLFGVAVLYGAFHTLDLGLLGQRVGPGPPAWAAAALMTTGLAIKTALFPLHFWLPRAHASAPAPVSALLSALVVKASFYLLLRLWFEVFPAAITPAAAQLVGALGAGAILWGSVQAIRQPRLKLLIAYSTVAQVGYLFLLLPLAGGDAGAGGADAWHGGVYHALSHALAKAAMFMAAGTIMRSLGSDHIVGISGIAGSLPVSTYAFGIAGLTLIGLPPSGGFVAKWLLLSAAIAGGQWWWAVVMLVGGILTAGYVFLVLGQELSQAPSDLAGRFAPVPRVMEYSAMLLALLAMLLGLRATEPLALLAIGSPFAAPGAGGE